jgi:RNA polymerase sigma-70 factor (ECF subfamily)
LRIATAKSIDWFRRRRRHQRLANEITAELDPPPVAAPTPRAVRLEEAMAALSPEQRALLELYYMEGFTTNEIAEVLNVPRGTVKTRLSALRNRLRERLEEPAHES